jgi:hypothetical protein
MLPTFTHHSNIHHWFAAKAGPALSATTARSQLFRSCNTHCRAMSVPTTVYARGSINSWAPQLRRMRQQLGLFASSQQTCPQSLLPAAALPQAALAQSAQSPRHLGRSPCLVTMQCLLLTLAAGRTPGHSSPGPQEASPRCTCLHEQHTSAGRDHLRAGFSSGDLQDLGMSILLPLG